MRKFLAFALVFAGAFLLVPTARAQFTTVTATVVDPNGIPYGNGTMSAVLVPGAPGGFRLSGQPYSGRVGPFTLDSTGKFTANFGDVTLITPSAQWQITINSNQGGIAPPLGTGGQTFVFTSSGTTISGSSPVDISASLNALAPKLTNFITGGTGTVTSVSGTAPIVATPNPIIGVGALSCPTCVTAAGGGSISLSANQVAFGSGTNTITGSNNFAYTSGKLLVQDTAPGLTQTGTIEVGGAGSGTSYNGEPAILEDISKNDNMFAEVIANAAATGNTGTTRQTFLGLSASSSSAGTPNTVAFTYFNGNVLQSEVTFGSGGTFAGQGNALEFNGDGSVDLLTVNNDTSLTDIKELPNAGIKFFTDANSPVELACQAGGGAGCPPLQFDGSTSGTAQIGVAAVAGTPNKILLPTTTGSSGQFLQTNGANPQQTVWATPTGTISGLTTGFIPKAGSATTIVNSLCDEGITTANTLTCTNSAGAAFTGPVKSGPDGVHPGDVSLVGNTTIVTPAANTANILGPSSATFTAYGLQLSGTGPSAAGLLHNSAPSSAVSQITYSPVVSADLNITTTTCTNQFITAISATGTGTCTSATLASAQFANQGTTTTVLHGNAAGNPSFAVVTPADAAGNTSGSGNFCLVTSCTMVTPTLGVATATSYKTSGGALVVSSTTPTISSGFGTSPSISASGGASTAAFRINVGTGGTAQTGVISLPAAPNNGWNCWADDITTQSATVYHTQQIGAGTSNTVTIGNFSTAGAAAAWAASDILIVTCLGY